MSTIKILFVCHGNICRSVMAEYIFKHLADEAGCSACYEVASAAVSNEETGNDIYPPSKRKLREKGIPFAHHAAHRITREEYNRYNLIICADYANIRRLAYLLGEDYAQLPQQKVSLMMQWAGEDRDVADPWYTGDFEEAYQDIYASCQAILAQQLAHNTV